MMKASHRTLVVLSCFVLGTPTASAEEKETPPLNPVVITTRLHGSAVLKVVIDAKGVNARVDLDEEPLAGGILFSPLTSLPLDQCAKTAEGLDAAVAAIQNDKLFKAKEVGNLGMTVGTQVVVTRKDGKEKKEERTVVILRKKRAEFELSLPWDRTQLTLDPDEAVKLAKALRLAPAVCARLKSSIDSQSIYKAPPAGTTKEEDPLQLDNIPAFAGTSQEPVLLRYKRKTGQVEKMAMDIDVDARARQGSEETRLKMTMRIEAKSVVTAVDDEGNISIVLKITRMYLKSSGEKDVEFDSDKRPDDPAFKGVTAMIGVGIPCKISPVGKMLETDLEPLRLAASRAGNAALAKSFEDSTKQMFEGTYIQLGEKAVKAGDTYKAGTIVADKMKTHNSFKIRAVSKDETQVLLEPVCDLEIAPGAFGDDVEAKLKSQRVVGWLLFDLQTGHMSKAALRSHMLVDTNAKGQKGTVEMTTKVKMTSSLE
jgi:hypothetical protein